MIELAMQIQGERMPPHNTEAEQSVLGSILLQPSALISAMEFLQAHDFYRKAHQLIFQTMIDLNEKNEEIDVVTVSNLLEMNKQLEDVGGSAYLAEIANVVPTAANIEYYSKIVEERSLLRRLIKASHDIINETYEESDDVSNILDAAEQKILEVSERKNRSGFLKISDVLRDAMEEIDDLYKNAEEITGLSTGYRALDLMTAGLHEDELIILAARPGEVKRPLP